MVTIFLTKDDNNNFIFNSLVGTTIEINNTLNTWNSIHFYEWDREKNILKLALKREAKLIKTVEVPIDKNFIQVMEYAYGIEIIEKEDSFLKVWFSKSSKEREEIRRGISLLINKGYETIQEVPIQQKEAFLILYELDLNKFKNSKELIEIVKDSYI